MNNDYSWAFWLIIAAPIVFILWRDQQRSQERFTDSFLNFNTQCYPVSEPMGPQQDGSRIFACPTSEHNQCLTTRPREQWKIPRESPGPACSRPTSMMTKMF